jgi:hypothetical protein
MSNLRNRIAARLQEKKSGKARKSAQQKVAAAWTIAKTMLPGAPAEAQEKLASSLMTAGTRILTAALKQTAISANYTKLAEKLEDVHKISLNDLMEDESLLSKLDKEVAKELKTEDPSKVAKAKKKKADDVPAEDAPAEDAPVDEVPVKDMDGGSDLPPAPADMPSSEPVIPAESKVELHNKIDQAETAISELEREIMNTQEAELNINAAFNDEVAGEKRMNLAHEEDVHDEQFNIDVDWDDDSELIPNLEADEAEQDEHGFFGPSSVETMEASLDTDADAEIASVSDAATFFASAEDNEEDQIGGLMRRASDVIKPGEAAKEFEADFAEDRDFDTDHEDSILHELLNGLDEKVMVQERDTQPEFEAPKTAKAASLQPKTVVRAKGGKPVKSLGDVAPKAKIASEAESIAKALFGDE